MATEDRSRYERLPRHPGIQRVHRERCTYVAGRRCNCAPGYRAEAFDRITAKRAYRTFDALEAAARWRADKRSAIRDGRHRVTDTLILADAWAQFYGEVEAGVAKASGGQDYKPAVVRAYESKFRNYLLPRFGRVVLSELRLVHVQTLVDELVAAGQAPRTVRNAIMPLRVLYRWAIRRELATLNPCDGVALPTGETARDRIAAPAEAVALLGALPDAGDRAIWATAFFAGLRRGELMGLLWDDVSLATRRLRVARSYDPGSQSYGSPKTKKGTREVGIPRLLLPYLAALDGTEGLVFGPGTGVPFHDGRLRDRAREAWAAAGLEPIGLHEARHTFASLMIEAGVNIKKVSEYMGHASVNITLDRYGHLLPGDVDTTLEQFDAYLEGALDA